MQLHTRVNFVWALAMCLGFALPQAVQAAYYGEITTEVIYDCDADGLADPGDEVEFRITVTTDEIDNAPEFSVLVNPNFTAPRPFYLVEGRETAYASNGEATTVYTETDPFYGEEGYHFLATFTPAPASGVTLYASYVVTVSTNLDPGLDEQLDIYHYLALDLNAMGPYAYLFADVYFDHDGVCIPPTEEPFVLDLSADLSVDADEDGKLGWEDTWHISIDADSGSIDPTTFVWRVEATAPLAASDTTGQALLAAGLDGTPADLDGTDNFELDLQWPIGSAVELPETVTVKVSAVREDNVVIRARTVTIQTHAPDEFALDVTAYLSRDLVADGALGIEDTWTVTVAADVGDLEDPDSIIWRVEAAAPLAADDSTAEAYLAAGVTGTTMDVDGVESFSFNLYLPQFSDASTASALDVIVSAVRDDGEVIQARTLTIQTAPSFDPALRVSIVPLGERSHGSPDNHAYFSESVEFSSGVSTDTPLEVFDVTIEMVSGSTASMDHFFAPSGYTGKGAVGPYALDSTQSVVGPKWQLGIHGEYGTRKANYAVRAAYRIPGSTRVLYADHRETVEYSFAYEEEDKALGPVVALGALGAAGLYRWRRRRVHQA